MAIERTHDAFPEYAPPRDAMIDNEEQAQSTEPAIEDVATQIIDLEDQFELLNEIGRGGSAVVFRARDRALDREVAIKLVRTRIAGSNDDAIERIEREARTVAKLEHANIVRVHTVRKLRDGSVALIMQLVPGRTLKQAIVEDGPFSAERAERILLNVAQALAYAHARGVVHRDVKPENIFLHAESGEALLSDFGIAHSTEYDSRLTMTGAAIGTPAYMSPEQIDGAKTTARSDIYSLGLVAWEMLTGERPWEGETLYNVISKQKHEDLPTIEALRPGFKKPLQYIVERMLQKKPAARWANVESLIAILTHWTPPSDFPQWEAVHERQLNVVRAAQKGKAPTSTNTPTSSSLATVRFPRPKTPSSEQMVIPASMQQRATPAEVEEVGEDFDDDTPSWGAEPEPKNSNWRVIAGVIALLAIIAGSGTGYALRTGRIALPPSIAAKLGIKVKPTTLASQTALVPDSLNGRKPDTNAALDTSALVQARLAAGLSANGTPLNGGAAPPVSGAAVDKPPAATVSVLPAPSNATTTASNKLPAQIVAPVVLKPTAPEPIVPSVRATDDRGTIAAGGRHSCVLNIARVFCWGANDRGQLGDGELEARDTPSGIVGDLEFAQVSAGRAHSCGVTRGGDAYCWGSDERGQLGDATTTSRSAPVRVAGNLSFQLVKAGVDHTCGLTTGGEIACWGLNANGQLGDGTTTNHSAPITIKISVRFISLTVGWTHTCAITGDGIAMCWGDNSSGQLGNDSRREQHVPEAVVGALHFTSIAAGSGHTCGITDAGDAYCWGKNTYGQLGTGNTSDQNAPAKVETQTKFTSVTLGGVHSCARTRSLQVWCWGRNSYGQLGDGSTVNRDTPVRVVGATSFVSLNATGAHTCASTNDGDSLCWGFNTDGQLGDGTHDHHSRPARVSPPGR